MKITLSIIENGSRSVITHTVRTTDLRAVHASCRKQFGPATGVVIGLNRRVTWTFERASVQVSGPRVRQSLGYRL
jgi:hypothetical protein